ncbi:pyrroloquinoline quinone biosynthesis peptide chaperone PqqD [Zavarzinia compransoris]|uniref:Pyrroloquinoline quinone biosynthesis peptide chaperone PqqD n=2 Tax=Zavarzinia compransoris TaxID=1264899 RepID=A0A317E221_9PROT|nr:pyrroloquinoline quinone biosynthesis peptide chaperone PqqD [Zavarzinia compransoris]
MPRLAPGARLAYDGRRGQWLIQAPERFVLLDEIAHAVVSRLDGRTRLAQVIDGLAGDYGAPRAEVAADVTTLITDLVERGVVR